MVISIVMFVYQGRTLLNVPNAPLQVHRHLWPWLAQASARGAWRSPRPPPWDAAAPAPSGTGGAGAAGAGGATSSASSGSGGTSGGAWGNPIPLVGFDRRCTKLRLDDLGCTPWWLRTPLKKIILILWKNDWDSKWSNGIRPWWMNMRNPQGIPSSIVLLVGKWKVNAFQLKGLPRI